MSLSKFFHTLFKTKIAILKCVKELEDSIVFHAQIHKHHKRCACCKSKYVRIKDSKERTFRGCDLGGKKTFMKLMTYKFRCLNCGKTRWMDLPFTMGKLPMMRSFIEYVISLAAISTLQDVARFLSLEWKTVKNIDRANLRRRPKQFSFRKLRYLSIDEIAIKKGHNYMTIISDVSTGQIIYAVKGRKEEELRGFLRQLALRARRLRGVAMDMSAGYARLVRKYLPHAAIIFDRFHVTKVLNKAVDDLRKAECRKYYAQGLNIGKGDRFLLLHNFDNLDDAQKSSLEKLFEVNRALAIAYTMKEQFRVFWNGKTREDGARMLIHWCTQAYLSNIPQLKKAAKTLIRHADGLLNYFDHRISNGKAEGINNKIKVMKRQSYGFRDIEYFILKLYNLHKTKHVLVG
jgi:transposase